jgi:hypothetical protein
MMSNDDNNWMPTPPDGPGRLRAMLNRLGEDQKKLTEHPIYKEGYEAGYQVAQENHRLLTQVLSKVYNINE